VQTCEFSANKPGRLEFNGLELFPELECASKLRADYASVKVEIRSATEFSPDVDLKIDVDELLTREKVVRWIDESHLRLLLKVRQCTSLLQFYHSECSVPIGGCSVQEETAERSLERIWKGT
jgi:hypothetical protein